MDHLPLDLPSVGYFLLARVELGKKTTSASLSVEKKGGPDEGGLDVD